MKLNKISDIIPYIEQGKTYAEIGRKFKRSEATIKRYVKKLKDEGYTLSIKRGRKTLKV